MASDTGKKKILFLDDRSQRIHDAFSRFQRHDLTIVTSVKECLHFLSRDEWNIVYLDHDLGGEEYCDPDSPTSGMEIVRYLEKTIWPKHKRKPEFIIHSSNEFAACTMEQRLLAIGFSAVQIRYKYGILENL